MTSLLNKSQLFSSSDSEELTPGGTVFKKYKCFSFLLQNSILMKFCGAAEMLSLTDKSCFPDVQQMSHHCGFDIFPSENEEEEMINPANLERQQHSQHLSNIITNP